nr:uncharacterized protein LOC122269851 [Parasteatoda tepidariorum]
MPVYSKLYILVIILKASMAQEVQERTFDLHNSRSIGLEEIVLFLIGLGLASSIAMSIVMGPIFAIFYSSINGLPFGGINGGNQIPTVQNGSRKIGNFTNFESYLRKKLQVGLKLLDEALKKYSNNS